MEPLSLHDTVFNALVAAAGVLAGAIASVAGFGIGSILTPLFAYRTGTKLAVAAVSIPHFVSTAYRFWLLRADIDRATLLNFGIMSALGGLTGAMLSASASNPILTMVFGVVLIFVAVSELSGLARRMRFHGAVVWIAGALSGFLGGLVGNQGGIRSGALLGFDLPKRAFVATATATGVIVDVARMPVYLATQQVQLATLWVPICIAIVATLIGTVLGKRYLERIPEPLFRKLVAVLVLGLGAYMLAVAERSIA